MVGRVFRAVLFGGLVLALWSLARPARAASLAPFCDDRGATALAPAPALEPTDDAVLRASAPPCDSGKAVDGLTFAPAHPLAPAATAPTDAAVPTPVLLVPVAPSEPLDFTRTTTRSRRGMHSRVERPPRG